MTLLWLAAIGLIGDMADGRRLPRTDRGAATLGQDGAARRRLADQRAAANGRRRCRSGLAPAAAIERPKEITKGQDADALALHAAKAEVRAAMDEAKRDAAAGRRRRRPDPARLAVPDPSR